MRITSEATVDIERPERWAKQLVSHFGSKLPVDTHETGSVIHFDGADVTVSVSDDHLNFAVGAVNADALARIEDVVARHLRRFARRDELPVDWTRD